MQDILDRVSEDIRLRGMSEGTRAVYLNRITRYLRFIGDVDLDDTGADDLRRRSLYLRYDRGLSEVAVNTYVAAVTYMYDVTLEGPVSHRRAHDRAQARRLRVLRLRAVRDEPRALTSP